MIKLKRSRWISAFFLSCTITAAMAFPAAAFQTQEMDTMDADSEIRVFDQVGLFTEEELGQLESAVADCRESTGMDVVIVSDYAQEDATAEEYADDFYDYGGFGTGKNADGVLLLYYMDGPGKSGGECAVSTTGKMKLVLTDDRIDSILDDVYDELSGRDFVTATTRFLDDVDYYVDQGIEDGQYTYDRDTGEIVYYHSIKWYEAVVAAAVAGFLAFSVCQNVKRRYAMKQSSRETANSLQAYRADCAFHFSVTGDKLLNQYTRTTRIPKNTSSGGGRSSSGSSSGRSTVHTSSSGRSHGGGSRRF